MRLTKQQNYLKMNKSLSVFTQEFSIVYVASGKDVSDCLLRAKNAKHVAKLVYEELYEKTELDKELDEMPIPEEIRTKYRGMSHHDAHKIAPIEHIGFYAGWMLEDIEETTKQKSSSRLERAVQTMVWAKENEVVIPLRRLM